MISLRIAQIAPLSEPVPPSHYGGTERVVSYLTEGLVRRGHEVTLYAAGESRTAGRLIQCAPKPFRGDPPRDPVLLNLLALEAVYSGADHFDLIHAHLDYLVLPFARRTATPTPITLHGRLDVPEELVGMYARYPEVPLVSISDRQREPLGRAGSWAATIHHGVPLDRYPFVPTPGDYLAFLGRVSPEKGVDTAIRVAEAAGLPLRIGAKVDRADQDYFEGVVRPMLRSGLVEFLGEVDDDTKAELLSHARALLLPLDWPEPFGLVMIEAMACGTPVIARPCGAAPEVVVDGATGYLRRDFRELVQAVTSVGALDRRACRLHVERNFSVELMLDRYEDLYRTMIGDRARFSAAT